MTTPRIYVACLAAYNNGELHGAWIDAADETDSVQEQITAMLARSPIPGAEEFAIHDYDEFAGIEIGEYEPIDRVCALARLVEEQGEAFAAWVSYDSSVADDLDTIEERFNDEYVGEYDSGREFAMVLADEYGTNAVATAIGSDEDIPEFVLSYLNWDAIARDLLTDRYYSVRSSYGIYVFRRI